MRQVTHSPGGWGGRGGEGGGGAFFFLLWVRGRVSFLLRVRGRVFFFAAGAGATRARSLTHRGGPRKKHPQQKSTHNKKKNTGSNPKP